MTNFGTGREAEAQAARYLEKSGYRIMAQNWRTRYCEIDIVAVKNNTVHFVEVKYREHPEQGYGLDYITTKKLRQMHFAAEMWLQDSNWSGDCTLSAIEISGPTFEVTAFVPDCS